MIEHRSPTPAARRHDPDRRDRLVDVTIDVIAEHGLAGLTARRIAAAADVPLGSVTYHFDGLDDLVRAAFTRHAGRMAEVFRAHFAGVTDRTSMLDAATDFVLQGHGASHREWAVAYELYLAAMRDPALREVTEAWMGSSRDTLQRVLEPELARALDGVMEGLTMHATLTTAPPTREETRAVLARVLDVPVGGVAP
ncbi:TetR family transcriptional regulator C-terminal domain-containing protein [Klenkia sp. LSe6-5]|uniref:TetR family transcriptional regulator C-terminal domain-containing protein n=1 Tax=Klenkia sesuvii TaxID=3103137 RepID=A0ABU8DRY6_9ACTN